ncbi:hypothetical protein D3C84_435520 [compost metagenome]
MHHTIAVDEVHQVVTEAGGQYYFHAAQLALQRYVVPQGEGKHRWRDECAGGLIDGQAFHVSDTRLDRELLVLMDQRQAVAEVTGPPIHIAVAQALAFIHARHAHGEVGLPRVGVDSQLGD